MPEVELRAEASARAEIVLDRTPFYAESGGQVADTGLLRSADGTVLFAVDDVQRVAGTQTAGLTVHRGMLLGKVAVGDSVTGEVDADRRADTMRNHTGTHLLHRALRNVVGNQARQAGSLVHPDYLRFDYPFDRALTDDEKHAIEAEVRRIVREDRPVSIEWMTMAEAQAAGADAFFDEKYGERVRTIRVEGFSHELCGGTHCRASGQVGNFVITGERSIGSGVRRIEAVTGAAADRLMDERFATLDRAAEAVGARTPEALEERIAALQDGAARDEAPAARGWRRGEAQAGRSGRAGRGSRRRAPGSSVPRSTSSRSTRSRGSRRTCVASLPSGVIALGLDADEPQLFVTVSDDLVARGIVGGLARLGGRGSDGRPWRWAPRDGPGQGDTPGGARRRDRGRARRGRPRRRRVTPAAVRRGEAA